jgi:rhodanese-related sulfurtransferase
MPGLSEVSPSQLIRLLGTPDAPLLVDVRLPEDVAADPFVLPSARSCAHDEVAALSSWIGARSAVLVCQRGRKLSHGAAALLRSLGHRAEVVEGGTLAWAEAGLPRVAIAVAPTSGSLWVTRARPKIDRLACPWLIRRWLDPHARFLFVPAPEVLAVADRFGAQAFDIPGAPLEHDGDLCTFDTMIRRFGLSTEPLERLATVVRAADTDSHHLAPQAAGLLAVSVGLSRMFRDDLAQLESGMLLYDALYRWARDGFDEGHGWPAGRPA